MKIKGWAVFGGCYAKGLGNSRVQRSTWNTLSSAKYFMLSTCCMALNELWGGRKGDLPCKVFKGNANPDTHTHRNTHSSQWSYTHSSSSSRAMAFFFFFQCEYFSPEEKQTRVRARIRGQWCVFKETFPLFASLLSSVPPSNTNISRESERGRDERNVVDECVRKRGQLRADAC